MAKQTVNIGSFVGDPTADITRDAFDKINDNFNELYASFTYDISQSQLSEHNRSFILMRGNSLTYTLVNSLSIETGVPFYVIQNGTGFTIDSTAINANIPQALQDISGSIYVITKTGTTTGTDNYTILQIGVDIGVSDHGALTGLADDDHPQYLNDARHDAITGNPHGVTATDVGLGNVDNTSDLDKPVSTIQQAALDAKQDTLVSGTNIKTVNGTSLLGSGDVVISGGSAASRTGTTILFDTPSVYNAATFLTSGDITLSNAGGVFGVKSKTYCDSYTPNFDSGGLDKVVTGAFDNSKINIVEISYETTHYDIKIFNATLQQSANLLFITSPEPKTEVNSSDSVTIDVVAMNATAVEVQYRNTAGTWVSIGSATDLGSGSWQFSGWSATGVPTAIKAIATYADTSTQEVENLVHAISINDTFTGANGTLIDSRSPDSSYVNEWVIDTGDWEIQSNQLQITTADTNTHLVTHDAGTEDYIFSFDLVAFPTSATTQVVTRYVDNSNYVLFLFNINGTLTIIERTAAVNNTLYTSSTGFITPPDSIEIRVIQERVIFILNDEPVVFVDLASQLTGTKSGFRRGGANDTPTFDNAKIVPLTDQPINGAVSYSASKLGTRVITKGDATPDDDNGYGVFDIVTVGSTNYLFAAVKDSTNVFKGIICWTSSTSTPHTWTRNPGFIVSENEVSGVGAYHDGTQFHLVYTRRTDGILRYATVSTDLSTTTSQGIIKDLTGSSIYLRHASLLFENSTWYVAVDVRVDQPAGEFGYIGMLEGSSLSTLGDLKEILTPGFTHDACDLVAPSLKKEGAYYELFFAGYSGRDAAGFPKTSHLAISEVVNGKYQRVSDNPLLDLGTSGAIDDLEAGVPRRLPGTNILYYFCNGTPLAGAADGITYATLS
jgi:hypothetical protein